MKIEIQEITPQKARTMLEMNTRNFRDVRPYRVEQYAKMMAEGRWELNGETIKIADNYLIDGQHRLLAAIQADTSFRAIVVEGVQTDGLTVDMGQPRTLTQWCKHKGYKYSNFLPGMANLINLHDHGFWGKERGAASHFTKKITFTESLEIIEKNLDKMHQAIVAASHCKKIISQTSMASIIFIGCRDVDIEKSKWVEWFVKAINDGVGLDEDSPVFQFRNKMIQSFTSNKTFSQDAKRIMATLAWNLSINGEACSARKMNVMLSGPKKTRIPTVIYPLTQEMSDLEE